jgi:Tfp pilus assembly PilM family ATPase
VNLQRWLAPVPPSVAVEIAARRVTVVEVASPSGAVSAYAGEGLPEGVVTPAVAGPNIVQPDVVAGALKRSLERAGLDAVRRAALIVPDSSARVSLLTFDQIPARPQELDALVRWQLRKATPYPIEDAVVSQVPASTIDGRVTIAAVVARRDVVTQYEQVLASLGIHAGIVDLASFNVINAVLAAGGSADGDSLIVHVAPEATTLAILRGDALLFYRHRAHSDDEPLGSLVHQTTMFHEDRLGGGGFRRVWLSGAGPRIEQARREIATRTDAPVEPVDVRPAAAVEGLGRPSPDVLDALAAPVGMLLRDRVGAGG